MKALNTKERNSAILRFSLWLMICVLIICIPVLFTVVFPAYRDNEKCKEIMKELAKSREEVANLNREISFFKDAVAGQIREITIIETKFNTDKSKVNLCNQELLNIEGKLNSDTIGKAKWMVEMNKNLSAISSDFRSANDLISQSGKGGNVDIAKLNAVIKEFQKIADDIGNQLQFDAKNTLKAAFKRINADIKPAMENLQALRP
jgi:hypothetical protein